MANDDVYSDFIWGTVKTSSNKEKRFYNSFFYDNEEYSLHDNVMVYDEDQPDGHIAKIMKLWEDIANGAMVALLRWYLRPCELPSHLQSQVASGNPKELFLAFGRSKGVSNENKLDCIERKCKLLCTSKDSRNQQPSEEDLKTAEYSYNRIYNVDLKKLSNLEGIVKILGEDVLFNKSEWLSNKQLENQDKSSFPASAASAKATSAANQQLVEDGEVVPEAGLIKDLRENQGQSIPLKRASQDDDLPLKKAKFGSEDITAANGATLQPTVKKETFTLSSSVVRASPGAAERGSLKWQPPLTRSGSALSAESPAVFRTSEKKETVNLSSVSMISLRTAERSPLTVQQPLTRSSSTKIIEQSSLTARIDTNNAVETTTTERASFVDSRPQIGFLIPTRTRSKQVQHQDSVMSPKICEPQLANLAESMHLGRVLLIQNVDSSIDLKDMNDLMKSMLEGCSDIQMLRASGSLCAAAGEALLEFESVDLADAALQQFEENCLVIAGYTRPLIARKISLSEPGKIARYPGHFPLDNFKMWKQRQEEVMRKSFEIFHFADSNSLEFEMASEWRNLHEWLERCWKQLCKAHDEERNMVNEKYKKPKLRVP